MTEVTIRELRNHGGQVVDRVAAGEHITITRDGRPVAELRPLRNQALATAELLRRRRHLAPMDPASLRADLDAVIDPTL
jgi:prevent-host-death family protein